MSSIPQSGSIYSPDQSYASSYHYEDSPISPQIPRSYPDPLTSAPGAHHLQQGQPGQDHDHDPHNTAVLQQGQPKKQASSGTSEPKTRLRKACDSCSIRKVKCDESGPPCKSCAALDIPCTFQRPSRRRGPPNRHAEAIKRQRIEDDIYHISMSTGSPTHDAAYSLASLAAPTPLSAESICDLPTLEILLDDYFIYIHPLIPIPHEPTFRTAFAQREDRTNRSFLCMLATMIETLVSSFPRRPRQVFTSESARKQFPNAGAVIDRCHHVFLEARGTGYLEKPANFYQATSSYLAGLAAAYMYEMERMRLYFGECVIMLRSLGFHRADFPTRPSGYSPEPGSASAIMDTMTTNFIYRESGRRLFWLMFVGSMSMRQSEDNEATLFMPPMTHVEKLPPLPLEVDDEYITESLIFPQPVGVVSVLTGFNYNVKIFRAFHALATLEIAFGSDFVYDWERQRQIIRRALLSVKAVTDDAPTELQLNAMSEFGEWPPRSHEIAAYLHLLNGRQNSGGDISGLSAPSSTVAAQYPKRSVQFEIQKANIYATQLATRSYLVEKFWNLAEIHDQDKLAGAGFHSDRHSMSSSPTASALRSGIESRYTQVTGRTPSDSQMDAGEQFMAVEREDIVRDMATLLRSINQVNMEPNGGSFTNKIQQIASTLLETKRARMSLMPTLDSESVNNYLYVFLDILNKLQRLGTGRIRGADNFNGTGIGKTPEELEEEELIHWASLKDHQERFMRTEGLLKG